MEDDFEFSRPQQSHQHHQLYYEVRHRTLKRLLAAVGAALIVVGIAVAATFYVFPDWHSADYGNNSTSTSPSPTGGSTTPSIAQSETPTATPTPNTTPPPNNTNPQYSLQIDLTDDGFFPAFDFFTDDDPTNGYVNFVNQQQAFDSGLASVLETGQIYMGADYKNVSTGRGRNSIRIQSKQAWTVPASNTGVSALLFVLDLEHMPTGCATWPAWWLCGPSWPTHGEIDIIEGVNLNTINQMTLHTSPYCAMTSEANAGNGNQFLGKWANSGAQGTNCTVEGSDNSGCGIQFQNKTYGSPLNSAGGGVYVMEWLVNAPNQSGFIRSFFFYHGEEPEDLLNGSPDPSSWTVMPQSYFNLSEPSCNPQRFSNLSIIFDLTFCGDWAGSVWEYSSCAETYGKNCSTAVQNNPEAFAEAYWVINYLKVFSSWN